MSYFSPGHICIKTDDLEKTSKFYCDTLGMEKQFSFYRDGRVIGFYLKAAGNMFLEIIRSDDPRASHLKCSLSHFSLVTDSIESLKQKVTDAGYETGPLLWGCDQAYQFWTRDPNGIDFEIQQYTSKSAQNTGQDVYLDDKWDTSVSQPLLK